MASEPPESAAVGQLLLVRHGQSFANASQELSGWQDTDLTPLGQLQALEVAARLQQHGWLPDVAFTSYLQRAAKTCQVICDSLAAGAADKATPAGIPVRASWRLNERMYGCWVGLEALPAPAGRCAARPPPLPRSDPRWPGHEAKYKEVPQDQLPESESAEEAFDRVHAFYLEAILPCVLAGQRVLWVGHGGVFHTFAQQLIGENLRFANCQPYELRVDANGRPKCIVPCFQSM